MSTVKYFKASNKMRITKVIPANACDGCVDKILNEYINEKMTEKYIAKRDVVLSKEKALREEAQKKVIVLNKCRELQKTNIAYIEKEFLKCKAMLKYVCNKNKKNKEIKKMYKRSEKSRKKMWSIMTDEQKEIYKNMYKSK